MELLLRPWKMYADANGRSTPAEFWLFYVTKYAVFIALLVLAGGFASLTACR